MALIITLRPCPLGSHDFHSFAQPETSLYTVEPGIPLITATFPTSAENQNDARIVRFRLTRSSIDERGQAFAVRFVIGFGRRMILPSEQLCSSPAESDYGCEQNDFAMNAIRDR